MMKLRYIAMIALAALIGFSFVSCGDGDPAAQSVKYTSVKGDNTYELTITSNSSKAYSPVKDDTYVLIIKVTATGNKIGESTGTVSLVEGSTLTLSSGGATFTVTVSSGEMTAITVSGGGNIPGTSVPAPGTGMTDNSGGNQGSGSGPVTLSGTYYNMSCYQTRAEYAEEVTKLGYSSRNGAEADLIALGAPELMSKEAITFSGSNCKMEYYVIHGSTGDTSRGDDGYWPFISLWYDQDWEYTYGYHAVGNNIWIAEQGHNFGSGNLGEPDFVLSANGNTLTDVRWISIGETKVYTKK